MNLTTEQRVASMLPEDMGEGGGLLDDVTVTFKESRFALWDYNGKVPTANPALKIVMQDAENAEHVQYWSAGDVKNWVPSADGKYLVSTGQATTVVRTTNCGALMESLKERGFPPALLKAGDVSELDGLVAHMIRIPAPKRTGLAPRVAREDGRTFEDTILVVGDIITLPGEDGAKSTAAPARGRSRKTADDAPEKTDTVTPPPPNASNGDVEGETKTLIQKILEDNAATRPDGIPKADLPKLIMAEMRGKDRNLRSSMVKLVGDDDDFLLSGGDGIWVFEDGIVVAA